MRKLKGANKIGQGSSPGWTGEQVLYSKAEHRPLPACSFVKQGPWCLHTATEFWDQPEGEGAKLPKGPMPQEVGTGSQTQFHSPVPG